MQETRWKGASARVVTGKNSVFKIFWVGSTTGSEGVGKAALQKRIENVSKVNHMSARIIVLKLAFEGNICVVSGYAAGSGLTFKEKIVL